MMIIKNIHTGEEKEQRRAIWESSKNIIHEDWDIISEGDPVIFCTIYLGKKIEGSLIDREVALESIRKSPDKYSIKNWWEAETNKGKPKVTIDHKKISNPHNMPDVLKKDLLDALKKGKFISPNTKGPDNKSEVNKSHSNLVEKIIDDALLEAKKWMPSDEEYRANFEMLIDKRMEQAEPYLQMLLAEEVVKMDIDVLRKEFRKYYSEKEDTGDLQIENGDFAIEDGDIKTMPDIQNEDFKIFSQKFIDFTRYMKENNMIKDDKADIGKIVNQGNMIVNQQSTISEQNIKKTERANKGVNWTKLGSIAAIIGVLIAIIALFVNG
ncbi:MAG: hypothetical protein ABJH98_10715 [Reichenbachiella sp.]|uniref:hypothetical protein n=1 Tax=Reichenbachiella sp. TaxID=2184521 RepID=UPI003297259E